MNWRKLAVALTCMGAIIWFAHRETSIEALPRVDKIEQLRAANANTTFENGEHLEHIKVLHFEGEQLAELEAIVKNLKIRRETMLNRLHKEAIGVYLLTLITDEKTYDLYIEEPNRIIVHTDRTYIIQDNALIDFLKEQFSTVHPETGQNTEG